MSEAQDEEREVLQSIYDGDDNFKEINANCFQYKYGQEDTTTHKTFLLEISWPDNYPSELPTVNLDIFFNKHLPDDLKQEIGNKVLEQAEEFRDSPMTYSLFDWMNENCQEFLEKIPEFAQKEETQDKSEESNLPVAAKSKDKKEILTKSQKRRITERTNYKGERERGWDWVDVVKHLYQTGAGKDQ